MLAPDCNLRQYRLASRLLAPNLLSWEAALAALLQALGRVLSRLFYAFPRIREVWNSCSRSGQPAEPRALFSKTSLQCGMHSGRSYFRNIHHHPLPNVPYLLMMTSSVLRCAGYLTRPTGRRVLTHRLHDYVGLQAPAPVQTLVFIPKADAVYADNFRPLVGLPNTAIASLTKLCMCKCTQPSNFPSSGQTLVNIFREPQGNFLDMQTTQFPGLDVPVRGRPRKSHKERICC